MTTGGIFCLPPPRTIQCYLSRLLQVRSEVFPGDVGEVEGGHHFRLCEVQPPRFGEEVGLPLGEPRVVERGGEVDLRAVHRPPVVLRHHGRAVAQAPPPTCRTFNIGSRSYRNTVVRRHKGMELQNMEDGRAFPPVGSFGQTSGSERTDRHRAGGASRSLR